MEYMTVAETAQKWGVTERRLQEMIREGKLSKAYKLSTIWVMPDDTQKPPDGRVNNGQNYHKNNPKKSKSKGGERE